MIEPTAEPRQSRTQQAYEQLREALLTCRFAPGSRLHIANLCRTLGVSQGAVREALSRLTSEGLVQAEPQRGFRVTPTDATDLWHLAMARSDIEGLCLRSAIERGDESWAAGVTAAYLQLRATPQADPDHGDRFSPDFVLANGNFLDMLVSACDNPWLSRVRGVLCAQALRYRWLSKPGTGDPIAEQGQVVKYALARDADTAIDLLRCHMLEQARAMVAELEKVAPATAVAG